MVVRSQIISPANKNVVCLVCNFPDLVQFEPITSPTRAELDDPLLVALTDTTWTNRQNEANIDRKDGMNMGGTGLIRLSSFEDIYVVVAANDFPVIMCPRHKQQLEFKRTKRFSVHPKSTFFYTCNQIVNDNHSACGLNLYPEYPFEKFRQAVLNSNGAIANCPVKLRYDGAVLVR